MKNVHQRKLWIQNRFLSEFGSGSGLERFMDPDPVCPERLDPDLVNMIGSETLPGKLVAIGHRELMA